MNTADNNILKKNHSVWAIFSILNNTKMFGKPAMAWKIVSGKKVTADVFIRVIRKSRGEIIIKAVSPGSQEVLEKIAAGSQHLNLYLPEDMVLFQSEIKSFDQNGDIGLRIPEMMAQIDRRKHMRLTIGEIPLATVKFFKESHSLRSNTQLFEKGCFDISAGGLSFIVSRMESKYFSRGDYMSLVRIMVDGKEIPVSGEIVNILDVEPNSHNKLHYRGKKICLKYDTIDSKARQFLADFVFRHVDLSEAV